MPLKVRNFSTLSELELHLRGGVKTGVQPKTVGGSVLGLHGLTLIFAVPSATVTFDDPTGAGLSLSQVISQISAGLGAPAVTTEGTVNLTGSYPGITTETLILAINGGGDITITLATPANQAALLAAINAVTVALGVTASVGGGTPNGLVLTSTATGLPASIEIKGGTVNALVGISPELVTGVAVVVPRFKDGAIEMVEAVPTNGISLTGGTARAPLGMSGSTVTNVVYSAPGGSAPSFVTLQDSNRGDGYHLITEET